MEKQLEILRIAPNDCYCEFEINSLDNVKELSFLYSERDDENIKKIKLDKTNTKFIIDRIFNNVDYKCHVKAVLDDGTAIESVDRLFRCGFVPGVVVNYIHPDDYTYMPSGRSTASPSLLRIDANTLLASHDIYWGQASQDLSLVFISKDNGKSWSFHSKVYPCFWGKLFTHKGKVYMMGMKHEYGDMQLFESLDMGKTWSDPIVIIKEGERGPGGPHKAPMPVVVHNNRLWTGIDYGSWSLGGHASGFTSCGVDDDIMNPQSWITPEFLPYSSEWQGVPKGKSRGLLEGNIVVTPDDGLVNILRYEIKDCIPYHGKAIMLNIDKNDPHKDIEYGEVINFPGNHTKFVIRRSDNGSYYALVNRNVLEKDFQRNILSISHSEDLKDWKIVRDVINYHDNSYIEDHTKVGFQYPDFILEGNTIYALSRAGLNNSYNFHNANYILFHEFTNIDA